MKKLLSLIFISFIVSACSTGNKDMESSMQQEQATDNMAAEEQSAEVEPAAKEALYTLEGKVLTRPTNYRKWVYVGTPVTPNDMNNGKAPFPELHGVYIDPESYDVYKETGKFRDGTIIIKELVSVGSKAAPSGNGYFMGEFIGLEATIKSKAAYPDSPGNWAYYSFTNPEDGVLKDKAEPFPDAACNTCHETSAADDFVFTQYYPVLSAAKGFGAGNPEDLAQRTAGHGMVVSEK